MLVPNEKIKELTVEIPEGHRHLRATILLEDGMEFIFHEAAIANLVRAYVTVKTHPTIRKTRLKTLRLTERKEGYAEWQLVEEETR